MKLKLSAALAGAFALCGVVSPAYSDGFGFLYSGGSYTTISFPGSSSTGAQAINDSGQIVGQYQAAAPGGPYYGFLYSGGSYTTITPVAGYQATGANDINASGQIVGDVTGISGPDLGFLYSAGVYTTITPPGSTTPVPRAYAINNAGQIVGFYERFGYLYGGGSFTTIAPPGVTLSSALAINASGKVLGNVFNLSGTSSYGFLYSGGSYTTISFPGSSSTVAHGAMDLLTSARRGAFSAVSEFPPLRNRALGPLAMTVLPIPLARGATATVCAAVQATSPLLGRWAPAGLAAPGPRSALTAF